MTDMNRLVYGKVIIRGRIRAVTGLHIGAQREVSEIGGIDNYVIKDPVTGLPYIPGSSLKGRLRGLLELMVNTELEKGGNVPSQIKLKYKPGYCTVEEIKNKKCDRFFNRAVGKVVIHVCDEYETARVCPVCRLFGSSGNSNFPSRVIVRDARLAEEWVDRWKAGEEITEAKVEVAIDRVTSAANPRTNERVVAGAEFEFEIIYTIEDTAQWKEDLRNLFSAMKMLEDTYLGGSGSRGYGKVEFRLTEIVFRPLEYYTENGEEKTLVKKAPNEALTIEGVRGSFDELFKLSIGG
ncbi:CRISPR-associated RAMP protein, Csm3 family [Thermococcus cleftensis]|uniref:CRISPR system Cms endoribonuclease Csm3 n=1 Tax=Thermococcus cleftensis (strain DSM 27260 / KACC 17922 / CL1) TaxID=163003 RepID=I3ZWR6_THECF|nr:type III-A CRISPR-associated RAMP protein Csm3 [Thermococcus cleftensis]AFL96150.1 CRISPR-associated RAMP protein, Csm3 family [Thermococcus cleftensis]